MANTARFCILTEWLRNTPSVGYLLDRYELSFCLTALLFGRLADRPPPAVVRRRERAYSGIMKAIAAAVLIAAFVAVPLFAGQTARAGSGFADVYAAFAPLGVLHRSYGDYLFYGTDVVIPDGLASACDGCAYQAALLSVELLTQTGPQVAMTRPRLARLRADLADFCDVHSEALDDLVATQPVDLDRLKQASDEGLFADIYSLQQELQSVFGTYLDGITDEHEKWSFAVAFALRTLLAQESPETIDADLQDILYGSPDATGPPSFVPEEPADAIRQLITYVGIPLDTAAVDEIHRLAQLIYDNVVAEP